MELIPKPAIILKVTEDADSIKSFVLRFQDESKLEYLPGQFLEVTVQGVGESTFAVSRISEDGQEFTVSVKRIGHLTKMMHRMSVGEILGVRGPYGNNFPLAEWKQKGIVIIGGGIGLAPLRPVIDHIIRNRKDYGSLEIIFGARSPKDILYKSDLESWKKQENVDLHTTIDIPYEGWKGKVGFIPDFLRDLKIRPDNKIAVICGPPIMIKLSVMALIDLGWRSSDIFTTLEMKMQCGIGQCGRCNIGGILICKEGPVFNLEKLPKYAI